MTRTDAQTKANGFNTSANKNIRALYLSNRYGALMSSAGHKVLRNVAVSSAKLPWSVVAELDSIGVSL